MHKKKLNKRNFIIISTALAASLAFSVLRVLLDDYYFFGGLSFGPVLLTILFSRVMLTLIFVVYGITNLINNKHHAKGQVYIVVTLIFLFCLSFFIHIMILVQYNTLYLMQLFANIVAVMGCVMQLNEKPL